MTGQPVTKSPPYLGPGENSYNQPNSSRFGHITDDNMSGMQCKISQTECIIYSREEASTTLPSCHAWTLELEHSIEGSHVSPHMVPKLGRELVTG